MKKKEEKYEEYHAYFLSTISEPWITMKPIYLGAIPSGLGTPDIYCVVECNSQPMLRLDLYGGMYASLCEKVQMWQNWIVVGFAWQVHFVPLDEREGITRSYDLEGDFSSLSPTRDIMVVASAQALFGFDQEAQLLWQSENLAMDGVVITGIEGDRIVGRGQIDWEPPDGVWVPFSLSLSSGKRIQ